MTRDDYVRELFKQSYNLYLKYKDIVLSEDDVKKYLDEQKSITDTLGTDKLTMDMLGIIDKLLEDKK